MKMQGGGEFNSSRERAEGVEKVGRRERCDTKRQRRSWGKSEELDEKKRLREEPPGDVHKTKVQVSCITQDTVLQIMLSKYTDNNKKNFNCKGPELLTEKHWKIVCAWQGFTVYATH